jgi:predicted nucleic acid-binding Zn ribbon protein
MGSFRFGYPSEIVFSILKKESTNSDKCKEISPEEHHKKRRIK